MAMYVWAHIINNYVHFIFTLALRRGVEIPHVWRSYIIEIKLIGNLKIGNSIGIYLEFAFIKFDKIGNYIILLYLINSLWVFICIVNTGNILHLYSEKLKKRRKYTNIWNDIKFLFIKNMVKQYISLVK